MGVIKPFGSLGNNGASKCPRELLKFPVTMRTRNLKETKWKTNYPEERWCWYNPVGANSCGGVAAEVAVVHMYLKVKVKAANS